MTTKIRWDTICEVKNASSNKTVEAEIQDFTEKDRLNVVINKSVKLSMKWNGRVYEGRMAGIDFTSTGPRGQTYTEGR